MGERGLVTKRFNLFDFYFKPAYSGGYMEDEQVLSPLVKRVDVDQGFTMLVTN